MNNEQLYLSLFDYLQRPAGGTLGQDVYKKYLLYPKRFQYPVQRREVNTKTYSGKILMYPKEFLDQYFNPTTTHLR